MLAFKLDSHWMPNNFLFSAKVALETDSQRTCLWGEKSTFFCFFYFNLDKPGLILNKTIFLLSPASKAFKSISAVADKVNVQA